jgi:type IV secretory pathway ATPase VirB11/archaellum biosynthesis ATPase
VRQGIGGAIRRITAKKRSAGQSPPLVVELLGAPECTPELSYKKFPFSYSVTSRGGGKNEYAISVDLTGREMGRLRKTVEQISARLDPHSVDPLTFERLVGVLVQLAAAELGSTESGHIRELTELAAYEAMGLPRVLALAKDPLVTEFYVDSDTSPIYLDHAKVGRCSTTMLLTDRERKALETHLDTFRGYTLDYATPSMTNDLEVAGARLRVSLDLDPVAANRFSLDVRRLNLSDLTLDQLIHMDVLSEEASNFLVTWLGLGGNVTIVGETGTGKTTLLNALDEALDPDLRRVYVEDAVETRDLLERGYHQMKVKVDPVERGGDSVRSKSAEIVKALHRSPDIVILSEIQSDEHSRTFFHALSAGVRGIQTFHATTIEQALRRWIYVHGIAKQSVLELGVLVQMKRPDRLKPVRIVARICEVVAEGSEPRVREIYLRDRSGRLSRITDWQRLSPPPGRTWEELAMSLERREVRLN